MISTVTGSVATAVIAPVAYEPPSLVVLGSVEAITLSSRNGSFCDATGRSATNIKKCR